MKFITKPVSKLTPNERKACMAATLRPFSSMRDEMDRYARSNKKYPYGYEPARNMTIFMAWDGDRLAGWAMAFDNCNNARCFYVYVRRAYRRQGIASEFLRRARMGLKRPIHVFPWEHKSIEFFRTKVRAEKVLCAPGYPIR